MAFVKTSVGVSVVTKVDIDAIPSAHEPVVGQEKDGMVWDGVTWIPKEGLKSGSESEEE